jgi:hypothetical protein
MPYHPIITRLLKNQKPNAWQQHVDWAKDLESLKSPNVEVLNWLDRKTPESADFWDDGSHYTCRLFGEWYLFGR